MPQRLSSILPLLAACVASARIVSAQQFDFPAAAISDTAVLAGYLPRLAGQVLAGYRESDRRIYLANLFRLQAVAGRHGDAASTLAMLTREQGGHAVAEIRATNALYAAHARALQRAGNRSPESDLRQELVSTLRGMDDRSAALMMRALAFSPRALDGALSSALRRQQDKGSIPLGEALALVRAYHTRQTFRALRPLAQPVIAADDRRRYFIETNVLVGTPDGARVCALIVRPRRDPARLPALFNFTIYADTVTKLLEARRAASHGYVGVVGFSRGKLCGPGAAVPYVHDGSDAAALIDWIAQQPWSDGRVGMYGGSYEGFTTWAAAKHMPKALKAIMPLVAVAPGLDVPMEGNVFVNFVYPWPFFTTSNKALDSVTYNNFTRWNRLNREWYVSGRAYRDLDKIDGTPNPVFNEWIAHPTYDAYWQRMIPYGRDFSRINIPVLQTAGYFYGGPGAAVHYFTEHHRHNPQAEHYLVIGPYDHVPGQRGVVNALGDTAHTFAGYQLDPVALLDLQPLRYEWFDYVFKGAPRPAVLKDKVNYQVMGANVWKHAPSMAAMAERRSRFHFTTERGVDGFRMKEGTPVDTNSRTLSVDLGNRADIDRVVPGGGIVDNAVDTVDALKFVSEPLTARMELSGLFSGQLEFVTNKRDFDLFVSLSELTPTGQYVLLSTMNLRASHAASLMERRLLTPGKRERLPFASIRLASRQLEAGSRLVVVLGPIKAPVLQINYGTGKDVSDETIADAKEPLRIQWFGGSYIEVPLSRSR